MKFRVGSILKIQYTHGYVLAIITRSYNEFVDFVYLSGLGKGYTTTQYKSWLIKKSKVIIK